MGLSKNSLTCVDICPTVGSGRYSHLNVISPEENFSDEIAYGIELDEEDDTARRSLSIYICTLSGLDRVGADGHIVEVLGFTSLQ